MDGWLAQRPLIPIPAVHGSASGRLRRAAFGHQQPSGSYSRFLPTNIKAPITNTKTAKTYTSGQPGNSHRQRTTQTEATKNARVKRMFSRAQINSSIVSPCQASKCHCPLRVSSSHCSRESARGSFRPEGAVRVYACLRSTSTSLRVEGTDLFRCRELY